MLSNLRTTGARLIIFIKRLDIALMVTGEKKLTNSSDRTVWTECYLPHLMIYKSANDVDYVFVKLIQH